MEIKPDATMEIGGVTIGPNLTDEQAELLYAMGKDVVVFVLTALAKNVSPALVRAIRADEL